MLWYKGWLESRWRLLIAFIWVAWFLLQEFFSGVKLAAGVATLAQSATLIASFLPLLLVGAVPGSAGKHSRGTAGSGVL